MGLLNCDNQLTSIIVLLRSKLQSRLSQANSGTQEALPYLADPHKRTSSLFSKKEFWHGAPSAFGSGTALHLTSSLV